MGIQTSLDAVADAPAIVDAMRLADDLAFEAGRDPGVRTLRFLDRRSAATTRSSRSRRRTRSSEMNDGEAARLLVRLLTTTVRSSASTPRGRSDRDCRAPRRSGASSRSSSSGGFTGMLAQRTLEQWSGAVPESLVVGVEGALLGIREPAARGGLVETLGLVRAAIATAPLLRAATDAARRRPCASPPSRPSASGPRATVQEALDAASRRRGFLGDVARLAQRDLAARARRRRAHGAAHGRPAVPPRRHRPGAQRGRSGGQRRHRDAARAPRRRARGAAADGRRRPPHPRHHALARRGDAGRRRPRRDPRRRDGHVYGRIPLLRDAVPSAAAWPLRVAVRRGIRRVLRAAGGVDLLHLRMADVGSLAAADVARELGIPVVFTVAPDPHARHRVPRPRRAPHAGRLRAGGPRRALLVPHPPRAEPRGERGATVLFPRPRLDEDMRRLVGIDLSAHAERHTIVPEGVDLQTIDAALEDAGAAARGEAAARDRRAARLVAGLAPERRGLPLVVSVGRLHRVKGMAPLVRAWVDSGPRPREPADRRRRPAAPVARRARAARCDRGDRPGAEHARTGLVLAGHRPNDITARWLAAARFGLEG